MGTIIGRLFGQRHAYGMVAGVDVERFAGDAARQVGAQESGSVAHFLGVYAAPERGGLRHVFQHLAEA